MGKLLKFDQSTSDGWNSKEVQTDLLAQEEGERKPLANFIPDIPFLLLIERYKGRKEKKKSASTNSFVKCIINILIISHMPKGSNQLSS